MISIAAIIKNEQPYILEWLAYHMVLGINKFYIADNVSSDGTSELLYYLDKCKIIKKFHHPTENNTPPQLAAYSRMISNIDKKEWVAFIDADEFISPKNLENGLKDLTPLLDDQKNGAISLNWAVYGSSHSILPGNELVIERLTWRGVEAHPVNKHYKSIVRISDVQSVGHNPHAFKINPDKSFIMPNGKSQEKCDGISNETDWSVIRLNHYVIKSRSEFINKKLARGRATTTKENLGRNMDFFKNHDLNSLEQPMPLWFINKVKNKVKDIHQKLKSNGFELITNENPINFYRTQNEMGKGIIDSLTLANKKIHLRGWAVDSNKAPLHNIAIIVNDNILVEPTTFTLYDRPDVLSAGLSKEIKCGFISSLEIPETSIKQLQIYSTNILGLASLEFDLKAYKKLLY